MKYEDIEYKFLVGNNSIIFNAISILQILQYDNTISALF